MRKILFVGALAGLLAAGPAAAQERALDGVLGGLAGALVGGPVGLVAGGLVGVTAGPRDFLELGIERRPSWLSPWPTPPSLRALTDTTRF